MKGSGEHASLSESLERSYEFEKARADFYRAHRAELATKIRTGLITLNGASALGIATLYGSLSARNLGAAGVELPHIVWAFSCFLVGAWLGGWALHAQYIDAINAEGSTSARAQVRSRAIDGLASPGTDVTPAALEELKAIAFVERKHDLLAIRLQSWSWGAWGTGIMSLVLAVAIHAGKPPLSRAMQSAAAAVATH